MMSFGGDAGAYECVFCGSTWGRPDGLPRWTTCEECIEKSECEECAIMDELEPPFLPPVDPVYEIEVAPDLDESED